MNENTNKTSTKRSKKPAIIFAVCVLSGFLICGAFFAATTFMSEENNPYVADTIPDDLVYLFVEPDFDEDIMQNKAYTDKDRYFCYFDQYGGGWQVTIDMDNLDTYDESLALIVELVTSAIAGDHDAYNDCFSGEYLLANGYTDEFTMQKIYGIVIQKYSVTAKSVDGGIYNEYVYTLDYKIMENDGTLRRDIGSDMSRTQYITVTDRTGEYKIDRIRMFF